MQHNFCDASEADAPPNFLNTYPRKYMDFMPKTTYPSKTPVYEKDSLSSPSPIDSEKQELIDSLKIDALKDGEAFKTYIIDESLGFPTDDEQITFLTQVVSKFYWLKENSGGTSQVFEDALEKLEADLIVRVREYYGPCQLKIGTRTLEEKISALNFPDVVTNEKAKESIAKNDAYENNRLNVQFHGTKKPDDSFDEI